MPKIYCSLFCESTDRAKRPNRLSVLRRRGAVAACDPHASFISELEINDSRLITLIISAAFRTDLQLGYVLQESNPLADGVLPHGPEDCRLSSLAEEILTYLGGVAIQLPSNCILKYARLLQIKSDRLRKRPGMLSLRNPHYKDKFIMPTKLESDLVGMWILVLDSDGNSINQGRIIGMHQDNALTQRFSYLDGEPTDVILIPIMDLFNSDLYLIYATREAFRRCQLQELDRKGILGGTVDENLECDRWKEENGFL